MKFTKEKSELIKILSFVMTCFMVFYHTGGVDSSLAINSFDWALNDFLSRFFSNMGTVVMSYFLQ